MKNIKKALSIIISAVMIFGIVPHRAFAVNYYGVFYDSSKIKCEQIIHNPDGSTRYDEVSNNHFISSGVELKFSYIGTGPLDNNELTWSVNKYVYDEQTETSSPGDAIDPADIDLSKIDNYITLFMPATNIIVSVDDGSSSDDTDDGPWVALDSKTIKLSAVNSVTAIDKSITSEQESIAFYNTLLLGMMQEQISSFDAISFITAFFNEGEISEILPISISPYEEDSIPLPNFLYIPRGTITFPEPPEDSNGDGGGSTPPPAPQEPTESFAIEIIRTPFAKKALTITPDVKNIIQVDYDDDFWWYEDEDGDYTIPYFSSLTFNPGSVASDYTVNLKNGSATIYGEDALKSAVFAIVTALAYNGYKTEEIDGEATYIYPEQLKNGFFWVDINEKDKTIDLYINLDNDKAGTYDIVIDITEDLKYIEKLGKDVGNWKPDDGPAELKLDIFEAYAQLPLEISQTRECSVKGSVTLKFPTQLNKDLIIEGVKVISKFITGKGIDISDSYDNQVSNVLPYVKDVSFNTMTFVFNNDSTPSGGGGGRSGSVSFTLTYETNGGETIKSESHSAGDNVTLNKTPVKEGFTFTGWYADKECTQKIESITMNSSKTVYAGWSNGAEVVDENAPLLVVTINETKYQLRGRNMEMDSAPFIDANDRTMLPVRVVANALGISDNDISWDNTTKTACFTRPDGKVVACTVGSNIIKIGDEEVEIDTAPVIRNDRIYLPMRALFNAFNVSDDHIAWDGAARKVTVAKEALDDINALTEAAPVEEEPVEEVPAEEAPAAETPAEETPAEEVTAG